MDDSTLFSNWDDEEKFFRKKICNESKKEDLKSEYHIKTVISSPVLFKIYDKFVVWINKPFRGVSSGTINDEKYQNLILKEDTSCEISSENSSDYETYISKEKINELEDNEDIEVKHIEIIVKQTSLLIEGIEFFLSCDVRDSVVINGQKEEDVLILSLKTGFLLLIKIYFVPRFYKDTDYFFQNKEKIPVNSSFIFKPFIVQWWDASLSLASFSTSGFYLRTDHTGLCVVSSSLYNVFRIYEVDHTVNGIILKKHHNVEVDGIILHCMFISSIDKMKLKNKFTFLTLILTEQKNFVIILFSWFSLEEITHDFLKKKVSLKNDFDLPIFLIYLRKNDYLLFIYEDFLIYVSVEDLDAYEKKLKKIDSPWHSISFPTNYYFPRSNITSLNTINFDQVVISTNDGIIYLVTMIDKELKIKPILRINDSISVFSLEKIENNFCLIYGSSFGDNRKLLIDKIYDYNSIFVSKNNDLFYNSFKIIKDYYNWSPLIDVSFIDIHRYNNDLISGQEIWAITGFGSKKKLTQFHYGYKFKVNCIFKENFKLYDNIFFLKIKSLSLLLCSSQLRSYVFEIQIQKQINLIELKTNHLVLNQKTILFQNFQLDNDHYLIQVNDFGFLISNMLDFNHYYEIDNCKIFLSCFFINYLCIITKKKHSRINFVLSLYEFKYDTNLDKSKKITYKITSIDIDFQPSAVKCFLIKSLFYIFIPSFDDGLNIYRFDNNSIFKLKTIDLKVLNPYTFMNLFDNEEIVINDIFQFNDFFYFGSNDGYFIQVEFNNDFDFICKKYLKISNSPVSFVGIENDLLQFFVHSFGLWLVDFHHSDFPVKVYINELIEKQINKIINVNTDPKNQVFPNYFAFLRNDGLVFTEIFTLKQSFVSQIQIPLDAKKLSYFSKFSLFILLCDSKNPSERLSFVDRKTFKQLKHNESLLRNNKTIFKSLFKKNEFPISSCLWSFKKNNKIFTEFLIGSKIVNPSLDTQSPRGSFKVVEISHSFSECSTKSINVIELTSFLHSDPISCIKQLNSIILFSSDKSVYYTYYKLNEKKLSTVKLLTTLPSQIFKFNVDSHNNFFLITEHDGFYKYIIKVYDDNAILEYIEKNEDSNRYLNFTTLNSEIFITDKMNSCVYKMNKNEIKNKLLIYKSPRIFRVFSCKFSSYWLDFNDHNKNNSNIIVGVNGEILILKSVKLKFSSNVKKMNMCYDVVSFDNQISKIKRPFLNKVSGTGLLSINKPVFDYQINNENVFNCNSDEICKNSLVNIYL